MLLLFLTFFLASLAVALVVGWWAAGAWKLFQTRGRTRRPSGGGDR